MKNLILIFLLAASTMAVAQDQTPASTTDQSNEEAAPAVADQRVTPPVLINGQVTSLAFSDELTRSNVLRLGIGVGASYDDNALNSPTNPVGDFGYSVMPHIGLDIARERLIWNMNYSGGLTVNQRISERNMGSHDLGVAMTYRLAPHADLHLREQFSLTTGFLDQLQTIGNPVTGTINQPNPSGITPLARHQSNLTSGDFDYQFSADDMIGGGGTYGDTRFRDVPVGTQLVDSSTYTGNAFYSHRITPRNWTGVAYQYQKLDFKGLENTSTNSFLLFHTIYIQPRMTFSLFAGPEYSEVNSQTVQILATVPVISLAVVETTRKSWSVSGGASLGWQGVKNSVRFNAVRRVSDGGGLLGTVLMNTVNGVYRTQVSPSTAFSFGAVYGKNQALSSAVSNANSFDSASGSFAIEQRVFARLMLTAGYARDYQKLATSGTPADVNHNRGWVNLSYNFERPLGR